MAVQPATGDCKHINMPSGILRQVNLRLSLFLETVTVSETENVPETEAENVPETETECEAACECEVDLATGLARQCHLHGKLLDSGQAVLRLD